MAQADWNQNGCPCGQAWECRPSDPNPGCGQVRNLEELVEEARKVRKAEDAVAENERKAQKLMDAGAAFCMPVGGVRPMGPLEYLQKVEEELVAEHHMHKQEWERRSHKMLMVEQKLEVLRELMESFRGEV